MGGWECYLNVICIIFLGQSFPEEIISDFLKYNLQYRKALFSFNKTLT